MKILLVHSDFIEYEAKEKAIKNPENIEKHKERIEDCLVVFSTAEENDTEKVIEGTVKEIQNVAEQVKAKKIVVYPFVHLSSKPAKPEMALRILEGIKKELSSKYEVHRAAFGYYKSFNIKCKGHPLSELSREITNEGVKKEERKIQKIGGKIVLDRKDLPANDHRILGEDLNIFHFADEVGAGLPLWLPNGAMLKHLLEDFMRKIEEKYGYKYVDTPHIAKGILYEATGHLPYYKDSMYTPIEIDGIEYYLKPMNCPHHHMIFKKIVNSYRDLPLRLAEPGMTYRNELSGVTYGLIRVRGFTQNDSHIYVTPEQLKEEFKKVLQLFDEVYKIMKIEGYWFRLSLPDFENNPDKFTGDPKRWEHACEEIRNAMKEHGAKFVEEKGEAAFYGPKIDVQIKNSLGKEETIATSQVDIVVPERLGLTYTDSNDQKKHVIVIHRAILGSYERFIAYLLEQTSGALPLWLSPVQVRVISFTDRNIPFAEKIMHEMKNKGIRMDSDFRSNTVDYKVREGEMMKVPFLVVIGDKEEQNNTLAVRKRGDRKVQFGVSKDEFIENILDEIKESK